MDYAYRVFRGVKTFYNTINPATLSGAIDVIVVEQPDGEFKSTPFHVRFGKYGVFSHSDKYVDIMVNGTEIDLKMKLADSGVAYFVEETTGAVPEYLIDSPVPDPARPTVDTVLAESAKKLDSENNELGIQRRNSLPNQDDRKGQAQEQSLSQVQRKSNLPFSPSLFSGRRYRSLPDLRVLSDRGPETTSDNDLKTADDTLLHNKRRPARRPLHHSKSQAFEKRKKDSASRDLNTDKILKSLMDQERTSGPRRKKSQRTAPINIQVDESDSELDSSVSSSTASSPSPSVIDGPDRDQNDDHHIADGALSDSELDHHRNTPELHSSRVTDWQWGQLPETFRAKSWSWFSWGSKRQPERNDGITLDELMSDAQNDPSKMEKYLGKASTSISVDSGNASRGVSQPSSPGAASESDTFADTVTPTQETVNLVPVPNMKLRTRSGQASISSTDDLHAFSEDDLESIEEEGGRTYIRSLRLSSDKLKSLGLVRGANECRFSITTKFQGTSWCICNIYLFKWYEQIVISDIDGTITKSDVLGHVIPAIGGTWAHTGVAELYTRIKNNGYKMVYLSSRAIGQSHTTKQYLKSVAQDSRQLPDGPVLLSPTSVLLAFRREVIERRPEEFKIAALSDLKKLFPVSNPFFAGFGNRETDVTSYRAVDIPPARILIIDPSGRVRRSDSIGYVSSYSSMAAETVDYLFPPISKNPSLVTSSGSVNGSGWAGNEPLQHSAHTHWGTASRDVFNVSDDELANYEKNRKAAATRKK